MSSLTPISVLIPTKDEGANLPRCLAPLCGWADEIVVADSFSTDETAAIAESYGAKVVQFAYQGGWPKKRQAILDSFPFRNEWILLLDADETLLEPIRQEISEAICAREYDGYWLRFQIHFLGRPLRFGDTELWKLSLFRKGRGHYEKRLQSQDISMADIEVHEHVIVNGRVGRLKSPVCHENINSLDRYIQKHNEYSNWEAKAFREGTNGGVQPTLWGLQAQRRRWLKRALLRLPGSPLLFFFYKYLVKLGFLDGVPGLLYSCFQAIQLLHIKAKIYEMELARIAFGAGNKPSLAEGQAVRPAARSHAGQRNQCQDGGARRSNDVEQTPQNRTRSCLERVQPWTRHS